MTQEKDTSLILLALSELNSTMQTLTKEVKRSNAINEKFLLLEKKKTLTESKSNI